MLNNAASTGRQKEKRYSGGVDLQYFLTKHWEGLARFALESVENFNLAPGDDRTNTILWINIKYHFSS